VLPQNRYNVKRGIFFFRTQGGGSPAHRGEDEEQTEAGGTDMGDKKLKVAVVVGHHSFQFQPFQELFESIPEIHFYLQHMEQFTSSTEEVRRSYDVIVFYTMWLDTPVNDGPWYEGAALDAMNDLGETGQGLFILHHTILAFDQWKVWADLTGLDPKKYRDYYLDQTMHFHVEKPDHPIMKGVEPDFTMVDEAYDCDGVSDVPGVEVLMTTDYDKNIPTVAWTKTYKKSKVFCYQSGHDSTSYLNDNFRRIIRQGILWLADR